MQIVFRDNPVSVNDSRFEVVNGELFLKVGQVIDFEVTPSISLTLFTGSVSTILAFGVTNTNEAPTALTFTGGPIAENSANGTVIGTLAGIAPDAGDTFTLAETISGSFARLMFSCRMIWRCVVLCKIEQYWLCA